VRCWEGSRRLTDLWRTSTYKTLGEWKRTDRDSVRARVSPGVGWYAGTRWRMMWRRHQPCGAVFPLPSVPRPVSANVRIPNARD